MSFEYNGATISARVLSIADGDDIEAIVWRLNDSTPVYKAERWAEFLVGAEIEGDAPIPVVTAEASEEEARASYAAWRKLPRSFAKRWAGEVASVEVSPKKE